MSGMTLKERIETANQQGRIARVPFLTAGFPDPERFFPALRELDENGADIIEIGVPFSDPVADGPVVEDASRRALEMGISLDWVLKNLSALRPRLRAGLVLMGYYNPFFQYGLERLAADAAEAGVQGFIVPDLPLDENSPMRAALAAHSMDLIALIGPNTSNERMGEYARIATGYVYVASIMGTTGVRRDMTAQAAETVWRAREIFNLPVALGFGIKSPDQVKAMPVQPQAAIFGSALLRHLDEGGSAAEFMIPWNLN